MKIPLKIEARFVFGARLNTICQVHSVNNFSAYRSKSTWSLIVNHWVTRNAQLRYGSVGSAVMSERGTQMRINILYAKNIALTKRTVCYTERLIIIIWPVQFFAQNIGPTKSAVWYTERLIGIIWPSPILNAENIGPTKRAVWYTERLIVIIWPVQTRTLFYTRPAPGPCATSAFSWQGSWYRSATDCKNGKMWKPQVVEDSMNSVAYLPWCRVLLDKLTGL